MKRIWTAVPLVVATMLLTGCGSVNGVGPERVASGTTGSAAAPDGRALPDWHPPLPPGHPPITTGGAVREPDTGRVRDFKADPNEVIRI